MDGCFACMPWRSVPTSKTIGNTDCNDDHDFLMKRVAGRQMQRKLLRGQSSKLDEDTPEEIERITNLGLHALKLHCPGARVAVIGAGMYGCHIALMFAQHGFKVDLYDKADCLFAGASGHCAFRIHRGYHYPRSHKTRQMCSLDHDLFVRKYKHLVCTNENDKAKAVLISGDGKSMIDYGTMRTIMTGVSLPMEELGATELSALGFNCVEGGFINKEEPILYVDYPREWFRQELQKAGVAFHLGEEAGKIDGIEASGSMKEVNMKGKTFDYVVNCTYNQCFTYTPEDHKFVFEICLSPVVAMKEGVTPTSFGVFDGPFPSLEPYLFKGAYPERFAKYEGRRLFQIWHIALTAVRRFDTAAEAQAAMKKGVLTQKEADDHIASMLVDVRKFYPNFDKEYEVVGHNLALKTKATDANAHRPLVVLQLDRVHPRLFTIISAKLSSIIHASRDLLMAMLETIIPDAAGHILERVEAVHGFHRQSTEPQFVDPHAFHME
eukprot:TRINITY_DN47230_c0_g1_i1.p1 TRINITY_DN47230_c0_g1~~TRINITY_DN47230_c0_g1_i1.p1  ORF type:complete len:494 (-),score=86.41 TRINITY_DN47230_c0_g1_i1:57-1538(-)